MFKDGHPTVTIRANEVYRTLRETLAPWFKIEGFRRTKGGMLGWYRPHDERYLVIGFYCWPPPGGDPLYGSCFTVEFSISKQPGIGWAGRNTARLNELLGTTQFDLFLEQQNSVIARLQKPGRNHSIFKMPATLIESYLSEFDPLTRDNAYRYSQWLRYQDEEDVRHWAEFLLKLMPELVPKFIALSEISSE